MTFDDFTNEARGRKGPKRRGSEDEFGMSRRDPRHSDHRKGVPFYDLGLPDSSPKGRGSRDRKKTADAIMIAGAYVPKVRLVVNDTKDRVLGKQVVVQANAKHDLYLFGCRLKREPEGRGKVRARTTDGSTTLYLVRLESGTEHWYPRKEILIGNEAEVYSFRGRVAFFESQIEILSKDYGPDRDMWVRRIRNNIILRARRLKEVGEKDLLVLKWAEMPIDTDAVKMPTIPTPPALPLSNVPGGLDIDNKRRVMGRWNEFDT